MPSKEKEYRPGDRVLRSRTKKRCGIILSCIYYTDPNHSAYYKRPDYSSVYVQSWFNGKKKTYSEFIDLLQLVMRKII